MGGAEGPNHVPFPRSSHFASALVALLLLGSPCQAQQPVPTPDAPSASPKLEALAPTSSLGDRTFPFKTLPIELEVQRGDVVLPITRVPELRKGDLVRLRVDLEAPELSSQNGDERARLRDWSVGWFLTTPEGSLVYDQARGDKADRGRIDLAAGQKETVLKVTHDRQKFPIFFFVRTRTLESWDTIRETREIKASNFVDHFGRYSDVVDDYQSLEVFLTSLQREDVQAETLEGRVSAGLARMGITVEAKNSLSDPQAVGKLLSELEQSFTKQGKFFQAEVAGKLLSQMIGNSDLGLIGAAVQIGGFFYRATDYHESYRWSSARLAPGSAPNRYLVMSSERIRYGEAEQAPDGTARDNVRSILVCTPMPTEPAQKPVLTWRSTAPDSLTPAPQGSGKPPQVRIDGGAPLTTGAQPALVERFALPDARVWDSLHGDDSPLRAEVTPGGTVQVTGWEGFWKADETSAEVRVQGHWGFDSLDLARFTALRSPLQSGLQLSRAPYLLNVGQKYRISLTSAAPQALSSATFESKDVALERESANRYSLRLDLAGIAPGPAKLRLYAGDSKDESGVVLTRDFWVIPEAKFHVVLPEGSRTAELVASSPELAAVLEQAVAMRIGKTTFQRQAGTALFQAQGTLDLGAEPVPLAELDFAARGKVGEVHVQRPERPARVDFLLYPILTNEPPAPWRIELDSPRTKVLATGARAEFRLRASAPWKGDTDLVLETRGGPTQTTRQTFRRRDSAATSSLPVLDIKGDLLFGEYTATSAGKLIARLRSGIEQAQLPLEWEVPTDWTIVDVPRFTRVSLAADGRATFEGSDLDVTVARVFSTAVGGEGSPLERSPDGSYQAAETSLDPEEFWLELRDLEGSGQRFRVHRTTNSPSAPPL